MPLVILVLYSLFILLVVYLLKNFSLIAAPIFFAVVVAYLFNPVVGWIERKTRLRRWLVTAVLIILLIVALTLILANLFPYFIDQTQRAADKLPQVPGGSQGPGLEAWRLPEPEIPRLRRAGST